MTAAPKLNKAAQLLADNVTRLMNSNEYKAALSFRKQFHHYSFNNIWLIYVQCPYASLVAGYRRWQELGRQVKKGEKSLAILAPIIKKQKDPQSPEAEQQERKLVGFRAASVFDVSQTEGDPLPQLPQPQALTGSSPELESYISRLTSFLNANGSTVEYRDIQANGLYNLRTKQIIINHSLEPFHRFKTLIHEAAHALMHASSHYPNQQAQDLSIIKLEAESCAYLVCDVLGLDTSRYSFAYLANWADTPEQLLPAAERACKAADAILFSLNWQQTSQATSTTPKLPTPKPPTPTTPKPSIPPTSKPQTSNEIPMNPQLTGMNQDDLEVAA